MTILLQINRTYRTRDGRQFGPMIARSDNRYPDHTFGVESSTPFIDCWRPDGSWHNDADLETEHDLVEEVLTAQSPQPNSESHPKAIEATLRLIVEYREAGIMTMEFGGWNPNQIRLAGDALFNLAIKLEQQS